MGSCASTISYNWALPGAIWTQCGYVGGAKIVKSHGMLALQACMPANSWALPQNGCAYHTAGIHISSALQTGFSCEAAVTHPSFLASGSAGSCRFHSSQVLIHASDLGQGSHAHCQAWWQSWQQVLPSSAKLAPISRMSLPFLDQDCWRIEDGDRRPRREVTVFCMAILLKAGMQLREAGSGPRPVMLLMKVSAVLMQCFEIWPIKRPLESQLPLESQMTS